MSVTMTGGCQCGRIRYTAEVDLATAYLCHCKMCCKATGGVSIAFVDPPRDMRHLPGIRSGEDERLQQRWRDARMEPPE